MRRSLLQHVLGLQSSNQSGVFAITRSDTALLAAMLLGERSLLDEQAKIDFQRTGSYHLLVVSGMAVAVLGFTIFLLLRAIRLPETVATLLSALGLAAYISVTDLGAPVQRAALMCAAYLLARLFYRERNALNAVGIAGLVVLAADSRSLFDAGFQMTFIAVLTIAGIAIPILERSTRPRRAALYQLDALGYDLHLEARQAQLRVMLRMMLGRLEQLLPRWIARLLLLGGLRAVLRTAELILVSALMQVALAAPMAVYFHRATTLALPANLVVVPLVSVLLPTAMATTLLSYGAAWLAWPGKCFTAILLHATQAGVFTFAHLRGAEWRVPDPPAWTVAFCMAALVACISFAKRAPRLSLCALTALGIGALLLVNARHPDTLPGQLEITAIDVGQGDSLLVVLPDGKTLLVDGGGTLGANTSGFDIGEDVVSPYLWARGFSHIDAVALSHAHGDHIGGLSAVLKNFHPGELWISPGPSTFALNSLINQSRAARMKMRTRVAGESFEFGGAKFDVLAPALDVNPSTQRDNDDSMVLRVSFGKTSALLEGDAEKKTERRIALDVGPINLLKVAHHGSSTSSIPELLSHGKPQFAVISVGRLNRYGHPTAQVLQRISQAGGCIFRTDLEGALSFYLDGTRMEAVHWGREREVINFRDPWSPPPKAGHCAGSR
ncbi:MAG: ComEC/Rec2 family competence protein [Acidobacteria bacterium]|nr:ComEC/Rec2 family competence protein [Acidobacteriota bacterium]